MSKINPSQQTPTKEKNSFAQSGKSVQITISWESENAQLKALNSHLKIENETLTKKLNQLKQYVIDLKTHINSAIYNQLESKNKKILEIKSQVDESSSKILSLAPEAEGFEAKFARQRSFRQKYYSFLKEKIKNETFYLNQEDIIKELKSKNKNWKIKHDNINENVSKFVDHYSNVYTKTDENKQIVVKLQEELSLKISINKNGVNVLNNKILKIQELQNTWNILKEENEQKYQREQKLKDKLKLINESNRRLNQYIKENNTWNIINNSGVHNTSTSFIIKQHKISQQKATDDIIFANTNKITINESNNLSKINEKEDDNNMKELAGLMQSILEE